MTCRYGCLYVGVGRSVPLRGCGIKFKVWCLDRLLEIRLGDGSLNRAVGLDLVRGYKTWGWVGDWKAIGGIGWVVCWLGEGFVEGLDWGECAVWGMDMGG